MLAHDPVARHPAHSRGATSVRCLHVRAHRYEPIGAHEPVWPAWYACDRSTKPRISTPRRTRTPRRTSEPSRRTSRPSRRAGSRRRSRRWTRGSGSPCAASPRARSLIPTPTRSPPNVPRPPRRTRRWTSSRASNKQAISAGTAALGSSPAATTPSPSSNSTASRRRNSCRPPRAPYRASGTSSHGRWWCSWAGGCSRRTRAGRR